MIILSNTDLLTAVLAATPATSNPTFYVSYYDATSDNGIVTYGDVASTPMTGTTPVSVIPPPPNATTVRNLSGMSMVNTDTASITFSLLLGGTPFIKIQMAVGDNFLYARETGEYVVRGTFQAYRGQTSLLQGLLRQEKATETILINGSDLATS